MEVEGPENKDSGPWLVSQCALSYLLLTRLL